MKKSSALNPFWFLFSLVLLISSGNLYAIGKSLNNGLALTKLRVLSQEDLKDVKWDKDTIYVLPSTPPEIEPIAGVLTVGSGSMISHVQLLCRSLGIPNGSISANEYKSLEKFDGKKVLYAAYDGKELIVKDAQEVTAKEEELIKKYMGETQVKPVRLPPVDFNVQKLVLLDDLDSVDSGKVAGPKAANLGFLKKLFPARVKDGFVIPFGVVAKLFKDSGVEREIGKLNSVSDPAQVSRQLELIRKMILSINIPSDLMSEIERLSKDLLDSNNGSGLFIRSDTNVEDLPQFSGAGLNKTVPNLLDLSKLAEAVKLVWSSPWRERSHSWRHRYILNPETILPSVLIMKSVDAKKAGVMATMNFETGSFEDLFISANEGLGFKVVDGLETPEQWVIHKDQGGQTIWERLELINAAYATTQFVLDNQNGGIAEIPTTLFDILDEDELTQLDDIVSEVKQRSSFPLPFESEFGVTEDGIVQLFQIRPLVIQGSDLSNKILRDIYREN